MVTVVLLILFALTAGSAFGQETQTAGERTVAPEVQKFGLIAAAIAFGFGALGAGIAIANVGAAAMGAVGERPEIAGQALIFIALAEGLVVFGFITALMILGKV
ncbi:MAG: ATPase [Spirochaetales bacterium]|nr:ATPase [Spirochaetales bacterium]